MSNGTTATVTVSAGQTTVANLSLSGDPRFFHIAAPFLFATASSFVDSSLAGHLLAFREVLDRIRHAPAGELMLVVGHTDDVGGSSGNDQLSQRRADSVLAVLTGDVPVWENIFQTERSNAWGDDNFRTMLTAVTGSAPTQTEINQHRQLTAAGAQRRATLFPQYFNILLGNPAASPQINTLVPATLACGERHVLASGNHQPSRRTEVFFFRGSSSPLIDCDEYPNWLIPCQILPPATVTVTIAAVDRIQQGQVEQIQVTVDPSPLPLATNITLELSTTSGTGEAQFVSTNAATMEITQSEAVRVRAITQSSAADNIRMTARISGQPAILAQEDFTVAGATSGPAITLASPVVVVKKPHTNPARQQVTLGIDPLTAALVGAGTFTRSDDRIRFFDAAAGGTEITFSGGDNVFSDAQLNAGVTLFAEGERASAALDDVQLELTLQPTSGAAGPPATATMTAVELTLDIAVSRAAPGVDPAPLSAADKINVGRFVQVGDPDRTHERAMLIIRQAQPAAFNGELELTAVGANLALFADELPAAGQVELNLPRVVPNGTIPANGTRFFVEGKSVSAAARDARYQLGIRNLEADGDRVNITVVQIEIVTQATAIAPATTFVRVGLWDNAFRADGTVFNEPAEADNFAGADTRRFYFRVRDAASQGSGHIDVDWHTVDQHDNNVDAPATRNVTLVEDAANPSVFISRALMLVTDRDDQNQTTHSGLPAGIPDTGLRRARGQSNHRLRFASILGSVIAEYRLGLVKLPVKKPAFRHRPSDERRRLPLQIFVLRTAPGGGGVINTSPGDPIWTRDLPVVEETYARLGIVVETVVAPLTPAGDIREERPFVQNETVHTGGPHAFTLMRTPVVKDPRNAIEVHSAAGGVQVLALLYDDDPRVPGAGEVKLDRATGRLTFGPGQQPGTQDRLEASYVVIGHRVVLINVPPGVVPGPGGIITLADEALIGGAFPALPHTIRVFYAGGLATFVAGESAPDIDFAGAPDVGTSFINAGTYGLGTVAHEIGHVLTNKTVAANTGHYVRPAAPAGNRLQTNQNLMANLPSPAAGGVNIRKRLWDAVDADGVVNQYTDIRGSHYTRPF